MRHFPRLGLGTALFLLLPLCNASITVYYQAGQTPLAQTTTTATGTAYTGLPAYDPTTLQAPAPPGPSVVPTEYALQLNASAPSGVGIAQNGSFMGFSIEMSVVNQVCESVWLLYLRRLLTSCLVGKNAYVVLPLRIYA